MMGFIEGQIADIKLFLLSVTRTFCYQKNKVVILLKNYIIE